jgi:hypothetical protein
MILGSFLLDVSLILGCYSDKFTVNGIKLISILILLQRGGGHAALLRFG